MANLEEKSCEYEGRSYDHGDVLNLSDRDLRCENGRWEDHLELDIMYSP